MDVLTVLRFLYHRIRFRILYYKAKRRTAELSRLAKKVKNTISQKSQSFSGLRWMLFNAPGYNLRTSPICWEAPVVILLYVNNRPTFGMGLELHKKQIYIRQLHGVAGVKLPPELTTLPALVVEATVEFARQEDMHAVRLYRAHCDLFYKDPYLSSLPEGKTRDEVVNEIRQRMRRRYDGTARQLGFVMKKDFGEIKISPQRP